MAAVLRGRAVCREEWWKEKWAAARTLGEALIRRPWRTPQERHDSLDTRADLVELYLLAQLWPNDKRSERLLALAFGHARQLVDETSDFPIPRLNTLRQLKHYTDWFNKYTPSLSILEGSARRLIAVLSRYQ